MSDLCPVAVIAVSNAIEDQPQTVQDANGLALKQKKYCDVTFTFPNLPDRIEAHEIFLKIRSPVFEQIFRMRKSGNVQGREIEISECTPERFQEFLEFIYMDKFEVNAAGALDLLHLAQKYKVQPLMTKCEELLKAEINVDNSVQVFETARRYGREDLVNRAGLTMAKSLADLIENGALANAEEETLIYLLKSDDLAMKEVELFDFMLKWGKRQVLHSDGDHVLQDKLKKVIPLIRYTNMTPQEFSAVVLPTRLLSAEEMLLVYSYVAGDEAMRQVRLVDFYRGNEEARPRSEPGLSRPLKLCTSFQVQAFKKLVTSDDVLRKPAITAIKVKWPSRVVQHSVVTDQSLNFSVCVKECSGQVNVHSAKLKFEKKLLNRKEGDEEEIPVEPPVELKPCFSYCVVLEDLAVHHDLPLDDYDEVSYMYSGKFSPYDLRPQTSVDLEGVEVELKQIQKNNRLANVSNRFNINVVRGIKICLV